MLLIPLREILRRFLFFLGYVALFAVVLGVQPRTSEGQELVGYWQWPTPIPQSPLLSPMIMPNCEKVENKNLAFLNLTNFNKTKNFQCKQQP